MSMLGFRRLYPMGNLVMILVRKKEEEKVLPRDSNHPTSATPTESRNSPNADSASLDQ
jgi:hypothetical protein